MPWLIAAVVLTMSVTVQGGCRRRPIMVDAYGNRVVDAHGVGPAVLPVGHGVVIVSPVASHPAAQPLTVKGYANVREGELLIEVRDSHGVVLATESTQAATGAYVWSSFGETVSFTLPPGESVTVMVRGHFDDYPDGQTPVTHTVEAAVTLAPGP